ncbi:MAG: hypothetical protein IME93_07635 [Proteobacteria bacterium]|nr:hypothetical protein [Pseudomonadota bacterium]
MTTSNERNRVPGLLKLSIVVSVCLALLLTVVLPGPATVMAADHQFAQSTSGLPLLLAAVDKKKEKKYKKTSRAKKKKTKNKKRLKTRGSDFDHVGTGFILSGSHMRANCDECHINGIFRGTPTDCAGCHDRGRVKASTVKPASHVRTQLSCDQCHSTRTWFGAIFDHSEAMPGTCITCHNNVTAPGKTAGHIVTTASCDECHKTTAWIPAGFRHAGVTPGTCSTCHNGSTAPGKPASHVITAASCDNCHSTRAWLPASFDHGSVVPGTCASCHNGSTAPGKPAGHVVTAESCDVCHSTNAWVPAGFDHATVAPGTCSTCHNGTTATGKPGGHFTTTQQCDACHSTSGWLPVGSYTHVSPLFPGAHRLSVTCIACHTGNTELVVWPFSAYKPECAGCHASNYDIGEHKKVESPVIYYTVDELKDCSGSCHIYEDDTFTTIKDSRSGEHRPGSSDF